jgi:hypothetical protein
MNLCGLRLSAPLTAMPGPLQYPPPLGLPFGTIQISLVFWCHIAFNNFPNLISANWNYLFYVPTRWAL